jgi:hypothetical protein
MTPTIPVVNFSWWGKELLIQMPANEIYGGAADKAKESMHPIL